MKIDREELARATEAGGWEKYKTFAKLSGPGWLQSAITLGGGSLAGALFLGVIGGYSILWVQLLAMILGVIMLCAISYITLSTVCCENNIGRCCNMTFFIHFKSYRM